MKNSQGMKTGAILCDRYRLDREIGKGGMGTVWAAYDCKENHMVALKMILPQLKHHQTQELRRRLLREARAIKKIPHPNIVVIYDVGETSQGEPFLVLEYLQGRTLGDLLKESWRIEPLVAARIMADVASGLAMAHGAQVIHRDLKPTNIFLRRVPGAPATALVPTILDFGVCKELDVIDDINTKTGVVPGSLAYMSPEQILDEGLDRRTDIYSLGIVLYELLTGARPFPGTAVDLYNQILTQSVPAPSRRVREVPPKLDAVVARCTSKLSDRYSEAIEVARDLYAIAGAREMKRTPTPLAVAVPIVKPSAYKAPIIAVVEDDSDMAPTLLRQPRVVEEQRRIDCQEIPTERSDNGTELMPLNQPIASPAPNWKQEMLDALEAHRQSSIHLERGESDVVSSGQTLMLDRTAPTEPIHENPSLTTSAVSALSQPDCRAPAAAKVPTGTPSTLLRRPMMMFGPLIGAFVLAASVTLFFVLRGDKPTQQPQLGVPVEASALPPQDPPSKQEPLSTPVDSTNIPPPTKPVQEKPLSPTGSSSTGTRGATSAFPQEARARANPTTPTGITSWPKPPQKELKCIGVGVFKRCK